MDNFLKMASPLALVAGMAGFAMTGSAFASGPGDHASQEWITPPIVQSAPTASQPVWDDLGAAATTVMPVQTAPMQAQAPVQQAPAPAPAQQAPGYEYPVATAPLAAPSQTYAQKPVASATTSSCPTYATSPCGIAQPMPRYSAPVGYHQPFYPRPVYQPPQLPAYRDRIVEKKVFVDRPIERKVYVNRPIYVDRPVYVPRPVPVVKRVPVPVDRPVYVEKRVAVPVIKNVAVPVDRPVYVERRVAVPVVKRVPVPVDRPVYVEKRVAVPVPVMKPVHIDRPVYVPQPVHHTPVYTAPTHNTSCPLPTVMQPAYNDCYGQGAGHLGAGHFGGGHVQGGYATPASYTTPTLNAGYEFGGVGSWGAQDCCTGFTGGMPFHGDHSKQAFSQISDRISQISARIADGENSGMITAMEAANLRKKIQTVSNDLTSARQDGRFEEREIEVVAASVRQLADQMKIAKQNEKIVEEQQKLAEQYANAYGFGAPQGITAASLRPQFGAAGAFLPSAQFPALQQALPYAYGGFGGMGFGGFGNF